MGGKRREIAGMRFGKLIAIEPVANNKQGWMWRCKCDCGNETIVQCGRLMRGDTKSCGCLKRTAGGKARTTHHHSNSRLYYIWSSIKQRCNNPNSQVYKHYGGRGIRVCDEWMDFATFEKWAIENGYDENAKRGECTIDRIDPNGNYDPSNCRWANMSTQQNNKRDIPLYEFDGKRMGISAWAKETGLKVSTIRGRLESGWSIERALTTAPLR